MLRARPNNEVLARAARIGSLLQPLAATSVLLQCVSASAGLAAIDATRPPSLRSALAKNKSCQVQKII